MKKNLWMVCGLMVSTSLLAQQATNLPVTERVETPAPAPAATTPAEPAAPPPVAVAGAPAATNAPAGTNAPAAKAAKKKAPQKKAAKKSAKKAPAKKAAPKPVVVPVELRSVPLTAGPAVVVANNVNVRGQAKLRSEIVGHVTKGQTLTVVQEITLTNSAPDEPSAWAEILLPPGSHVWVNSMYIDPATKAVKATRLNLRSGPGENYSVLGRMEHGEAVKELSTKGDWMEIEAPTNTHAFVAAQFLKQEEPAAPPTAVASAVAATPPTAAITEPTPATVAATPPVAEAPTPAASATATPAMTNETPVAVTETPAPETKPEEIVVPRVVQREGIVRGMTSIQAPTKFELISPENGKAIDYLFSRSSSLDLRRYKGLRVIVTGEEGLDERWGNTPVLTIQKIEMLSEPPVLDVSAEPR